MSMVGMVREVMLGYLGAGWNCCEQMVSDLR